MGFRVQGLGFRVWGLGFRQPLPALRQRGRRRELVVVEEQEAAIEDPGLPWQSTLNPNP